MESQRQKKVAGVLQNDLVNVLQKALRDAGNSHILISVTKVHVTTDLSIAKVYVSIFPLENGSRIVEEINELRPQIRHQIAQLTRHQLRRMPELNFYLDDSLDYIDGIDRSLKGIDDPLKDESLLIRRKKS